MSKHAKSAAFRSVFGDGSRWRSACSFSESPLPNPSPQGGGACRASRFPPNKPPSTRRPFGSAKDIGAGLSPSHLWGGVGEGRKLSNGNPCRFPSIPKTPPLFFPHPFRPCDNPATFRRNGWLEPTELWPAEGGEVWRAGPYRGPGACEQSSRPAGTPAARVELTTGRSCEGRNRWPGLAGPGGVCCVSHCPAGWPVCAARVPLATPA